MSPVRGIFDILRPRPSWFWRKVNLVWKQMSYLRIRSFSSSRIWNSDITCYFWLNGGQRLNFPPCLHVGHLKEFASLTAFLISLYIWALSPVKFYSKRKLWSWVRTLCTLYAELHPDPSARTPSVGWSISKHIKSPNTFGWGILV
jgi:hypothetical protein